MTHSHYNQSDFHLFEKENSNPYDFFKGKSLSSNNDRHLESEYFANFISGTSNSNAYANAATLTTDASTLSTNSAPFFSTSQIAEYLTKDYWVNTGGEAAHFNTPTITYNLTGLTTGVANLAREAFKLWGNLIAVSFQEVATGAQITLDDTNEGAYASMTSYNGVMLSAAINISQNWSNTYGINLQSYTMQTLIHEIGHSLGLGHTGAYNGTATYGVDNVFVNDSWQASIMSYFSQGENTFINGTSTLVLTPQMADIYAIQKLYGAEEINLGNSIYGFNSNLSGAYNFSNLSSSPAFTIVDSGGIDTLDVSLFTANQKIDLTSGSNSNIGGRIGNISIYETAVIENAIGGSGADMITGNDANNRLQGKNGNDNIAGGLGNDTLEAGSGNDTILGGEGGDWILGGDGVDVIIGGAGQDRFYFQSVAGSTNYDKINDFNALDDSIFLSRSYFTKLTLGEVKSGQFIIGAKALDLNDFLIYNPTTGTVSYDADGSKAGASKIIAQLALNLELTSGDFFVY